MAPRPVEWAPARIYPVIPTALIKADNPKIVLEGLKDGDLTAMIREARGVARGAR
jgi:hypothetical protein